MRDGDVVSHMDHVLLKRYVFVAAPPRRYLGFVETQTVAEYVEANKREWEELHDLLSQSKVDSSCYIKYPDWNV